MPRIQGDITVTLSVLDRLVDHEPGSQVEAPLSRAQSVRMLKAAVRHDLQALLNTRRVAVETDESLPEVNRSLYIYGLPDFSTCSLASPADQAKLLRQLATTIKLFESRLANVQITPIETTSLGIQRLKLRIDAVLLMDPQPEQVSFDTIIELKSGTCQVTGDAHAG
jgi:type VI secretion system protein ImpF